MRRPLVVQECHDEFLACTAAPPSPPAVPPRWGSRSRRPGAARAPGHSCRRGGPCKGCVRGVGGARGPRPESARRARAVRAARASTPAAPRHPPHRPRRRARACGAHPQAPEFRTPPRRRPCRSPSWRARPIAPRPNGTMRPPRPRCCAPSRARRGRGRRHCRRRRGPRRVLRDVASLGFLPFSFYFHVHTSFFRFATLSNRSLGKLGVGGTRCCMVRREWVCWKKKGAAQFAI